MIESSISWTICMLLTYLFYYIGTPFLLLLVFLDAFVGEFTKYHMGFILSGLILNLCGLFNFILVKFCLLSFLLIKNYDQLVKKYISGKKCLHAMLKLTRLTNMQSEKIDMMEYIDSTSTYVDNKIQYLNKSYLTAKTKIVETTNEIVETEMICDLKYAIKLSDNLIENLYNFAKVNTLLVGEFVYSIPYLKSYFDKGNKYLSVGTDLYSKYDKEDPFESPNLLEDMKIETPLNMQIDMDKLGDLAGMMTNFLDQMGGMNLDQNMFGNNNNIHNMIDSDITFNFNENWHQNKLSNFEILENFNSRIDEIDDEMTPLDDEIETNLMSPMLLNTNLDKIENMESAFDEEIHEMLNRGGKINEKQLLHAFDTVSKITSNTENFDSKITLKRKNK